MGELDVILAQIKQQKGSRYRMVRLDAANVDIKKFRGFEFVRGSDPEVKGTSLERDHTGDGKVAVGKLALARISEKDAQKHEKMISEKTDTKLRMIKGTYLKEGERIQRELGKDHAHFKTFVEEK